MNKVTNKYRHGDKFPATFDCSTEYAEQVEPLIDALHAKCLELGIPLLTFCTSKRVLEDVGQSYSCQESCHTQLTYSTLHGPSGLNLVALRNALTDDPQIALNAQRLSEQGPITIGIIESIFADLTAGKAIAHDGSVVTH